MQNELQEGLYNLLGDTGFDFMQLLMANIATLRRLKVKSVRTLASVPAEQRYAAMGGAASGNGGPQVHGPSVTTTVRVMSESDKQLAKLMRKAEKRRRRKVHQQGGGGGGGGGGDPLLSAGFSEEYLEQERALGLPERLPQGAVPGTEHFADTRRGRFGLPVGPATTGGFFQRKALPVGTERKNFKGYEQVHVPAPKKPAVAPGSLVAVSTLPDWTQLAFKVGHSPCVLVFSVLVGVADGVAWM